MEIPTFLKERREVRGESPQQLVPVRARHDDDEGVAEELGLAPKGGVAVSNDEKRQLDREQVVISEAQKRRFLGGMFRGIVTFLVGIRGRQAGTQKSIVELNSRVDELTKALNQVHQLIHKSALLTQMRNEVDMLQGHKEVLIGEVNELTEKLERLRPVAQVLDAAQEKVQEARTTVGELFQTEHFIEGIDQEQQPLIRESVERSIPFTGEKAEAQKKSEEDPELEAIHREEEKENFPDFEVESPFESVEEDMTEVRVEVDVNPNIPGKGGRRTRQEVAK